MIRLCIFFGLVAASILTAQTPTAGNIIKRARLVIGTEPALKDVVTLSIEGRIYPHNSKQIPARVVLTARKPCSQRLEVHMDEIVETTLLHGGEAVLIRTHKKEGISRMRTLSETERRCIEQSTRRLFNFYQPDKKNGERASYAGITQQQGQACDMITYTYPDATKTIRYFARQDGKLVATIREVAGSKIEIVEDGDLIVKGIRFPLSQRYFQDSKPLHRMGVIEIKVNEALQEGIFTIPELKK